MKIKDCIYLDHQATTPLDQTVYKEMAPYFMEKFGNPHSGDHSMGWEASEAVRLASMRISGLLGADPDEIILTSGATEANNLALLGIAKSSLKSGRRRILVTPIEHKCILAIAHVLKEEFDFQIEMIPVDAEGFINLEALQNLMDDDVFCISAMAVNNEIGTVQDLAKISEITKTHGAIFHCDAAQAPIALDLSNIAKLADLVSISAHKMYGPKGIGSLLIRRPLQRHVHPIIHGGGQQNNLRSGTLPVPLAVGMGAAAAKVQGECTDVVRKQISSLRNEFVAGLQRLPFPIKLNGPSLEKRRHPGNANIAFDGFEAEDILGMLQPRLAASTGSACTSGIIETSHVLSAIGCPDPLAKSSIRFSLGLQTTRTDIDEAIGLIENVLQKIDRLNMRAAV